MPTNRAGARHALAALDLARDAITGSPFDVVLGNLTGALLLIREVAGLSRLSRAPGGHIIVSGFMTDEDATP